MTGAIEAYPLCWPAGEPRNRKPQSSSFHQGTLKLGATVKALMQELIRMGATNIVISTNLPAKSDGTPYLSARLGADEDTGVAVYWNLQNQPYVMACDQWNRIVCNMHAIELTIRALRGIDRWGATKTMSQVFAGFKAIPESPWAALFKGATTEAEIKSRFHEKARQIHPDLGGSAEDMMSLNEARDAALALLRHL